MYIMCVFVVSVFYVWAYSKGVYLLLSSSPLVAYERHFIDTSTRFLVVGVTPILLLGSPTSQMPGLRGN